jgi:hypothetical protein
VWILECWRRSLDSPSKRKSGIEAIVDLEKLSSQLTESGEARAMGEAGESERRMELCVMV